MPPSNAESGEEFSAHAPPQNPKDAEGFPTAASYVCYPFVGKVPIGMHSSSGRENIEEDVKKNSSSPSVSDHAASGGQEESSELRATQLLDVVRHVYVESIFIVNL